MKDRKSGDNANEIMAVRYRVSDDDYIQIDCRCLNCRRNMILARDTVIDIESKTLGWLTIGRLY